MRIFYTQADLVLRALSEIVQESLFIAIIGAARDIHRGSSHVRYFVIVVLSAVSAALHGKECDRYNVQCECVCTRTFSHKHEQSQSL